jgi:hypothetical protein
MQRIYSKVDSDYEVSVEYSVVSLIRNGNHAVIMLERIKDSGYTITLADLMPRRDAGECYESYEITKEILKDKMYKGNVRKQAYDPSIIINLEQLSLREFLDVLKTRRAPPPRFEITPDKVVRRITAEQAQQLIDYIIEEQSSPPEFNIYGKDVARIIKKPAHNCTTWAIKALKEINIELTSSNCCPSCLPAKAQDYTKGNEGSTYIYGDAVGAALPQVNVKEAEQNGCLIL